MNELNRSSTEEHSYKKKTREITLSSFIFLSLTIAESELLQSASHLYRT